MRAISSKEYKRNSGTGVVTTQGGMYPADRSMPPGTGQILASVQSSPMVQKGAKPKQRTAVEGSQILVRGGPDLRNKAILEEAKSKGMGQLTQSTKQVRRQQAQLDYQNKNFFNLSNRKNYWTENQKIIQGYAKYYEAKAKVPHYTNQDNYVNSVVANQAYNAQPGSNLKYLGQLAPNGLTKDIQPSTLSNTGQPGPAQSNFMNISSSQNVAGGLSYTHGGPTGVGNHMGIIPKNASYSVPPRKGLNYQKNAQNILFTGTSTQLGGAGLSPSFLRKKFATGGPAAALNDFTSKTSAGQANKFKGMIFEMKMSELSNTQHLKQAYLFPDIHNSARSHLGSQRQSSNRQVFPRSSHDKQYYSGGTQNVNVHGAMVSNQHPTQQQILANSFGAGPGVNQGVQSAVAQMANTGPNITASAQSSLRAANASQATAVNNIIQGSGGLPSNAEGLMTVPNQDGMNLNVKLRFKIDLNRESKEQVLSQKQIDISLEKLNGIRKNPMDISGSQELDNTQVQPETSPFQPIPTENGGDLFDQRGQSRQHAIMSGSKGFQSSINNNTNNLGLSDSLMSSYQHYAQIKNNKAKNVRNFKYLYENPRKQSDKMQEMQQQYRLGDGSKDLIILNSNAASVTDNQSIMFKTGQAFFHPMQQKQNSVTDNTITSTLPVLSNQLYNQKHQSIQQTQQIMLQEKSRSIFGKPMQSSQTPKRNGENDLKKMATGVEKMSKAIEDDKNQIERGQYNNSQPTVQVQKQISRDHNGKIDLGIVNVNQQAYSQPEPANNNMKPKTHLNLYNPAAHKSEIDNMPGQLNNKMSSRSFADPIQEEENIKDYNSRILERAKAVLRRQVVHNSKNVILTFKSIEIQLAEEKIHNNKQEFKFLTPLYVPVHKLENYINLDKANLEIKVMRSIYQLEQPLNTTGQNNNEKPIEGDTSRDNTYGSYDSYINTGKKKATTFVYLDQDDIPKVNVKGVQQKFMSKKMLVKKKNENKFAQKQPEMSRLNFKNGQAISKNVEKSSSRKFLSRSNSPPKSFSQQNDMFTQNTGANQNSIQSFTSIQHDNTDRIDSPNYLSATYNLTKASNNLQPLIHKIKTNILTEQNKDYKVLISMPRLEYSIQSENFVYIKTLSPNEVQEYLSSLFLDWHTLALQQLMHYNKFKQLLLDVQNKVQNGINQKARRYGKSGEVLEPHDIEMRNHSMTKTKKDAQIQFAKCSHSHVPGQCKHDHVCKVREADDIIKTDKELLIKSKQPSPKRKQSRTVQRKMTLDSDNSRISLASNLLNQPCVYEMREKRYIDAPLAVIRKYNSIQEYDEFFLKHKNIANLRGCFDRDNVVGQIHLTTFSVSIKSMITNFSYKKNIQLSQWIDICGYFKKQINDDHDNPTQLIELITKLFEKKALRDQQDKFDIGQIDLSQFQKYFNQIDTDLRKKIIDSSGDILNLQNLKKKIKIVQSEFMKLQNNSKIINVDPLFNRPNYCGINTQKLPKEKFLIQIHKPQVQVAFKDQIYTKQLDEIDIEYLIRSKFQKWMQYMINSHFRVELNVGKDQPLPRIQEFLTLEEERANQKLLQHDFDLQDAMGRDDIKFQNSQNNMSRGASHRSLQEEIEIKEMEQRHQKKIHKWFPV